MKIRNTLKDARRLVIFGSMTPTDFSSCSVTVMIPQVAPRPDDKIAHDSHSRPLKDSDYNQLSVADVQTFAKYKGMDDMHKQDAVASDYKDGVTRKQYLSKEGEKEFTNRYTKKNKK